MEFVIGMWISLSGKNWKVQVNKIPETTLMSLNGRNGRFLIARFNFLCRQLPLLPLIPYHRADADGLVKGPLESGCVAIRGDRNALYIFFNPGCQ